MRWASARLAFALPGKRVGTRIAAEERLTHLERSGGRVSQADSLPVALDKGERVYRAHDLRLALPFFAERHRISKRLASTRLRAPPVVRLCRDDADGRMIFNVTPGHSSRYGGHVVKAMTRADNQKGRSRFRAVAPEMNERRDEDVPANNAHTNSRARQQQ